MKRRANEKDIISEAIGETERCEEEHEND